MDILGLIWIPDVLVWITVAAVGLYIYGTWPYNILSSLGYQGPKPAPFFGNVGLIFDRTKDHGNLISTKVGEEFLTIVKAIQKNSVDLFSHFASCDKTLKSQYGKMVALYEGRAPTLVVYDPQIIKQVLVKDFAHFTDRRELNMRGPQMKHSLIDVKGDEWRRIRNLVSPFFSTSKMRNHIGLLKTSIDRLIGKLDLILTKSGAEQGTLDAKKVFGDFTMDSICLTAFGLRINADEDSDNPFIQAAMKIMNPKSKIFLLVLGMIFPVLNKVYDRLGIDMWPSGSIQVLNEVVDTAIAERRKSNKEYPDFIQALLKAHQEDTDHETKEGLGQTDHSRKKGMTNDEIMANAVIFLLAGYDTTSTALSFLMYELADNPTWQQRVYDEINDVIGDDEITYDNLRELTTLDMCLDETLRLYPGVFRYDRRASDDVTIDGHVIPKGCLVIIPVWPLHHDPEYWPNPELFDPERFSPEKKKEVLNSYTYHPFGIGPRSCVGMRLAIVELKMAAVCMMQKFRWKVSEKTKQPIELDNRFFPVAKELWLQIEKRDLQ